MSVRVGPSNVTSRLLRREAEAYRHPKFAGTGSFARDTIRPA
jgi:hypothetical protein